MFAGVGIAELLAMKGLGSPWFAVCVEAEHDCFERQRWYYEHKMWWYVRACRVRVEREEREFWQKLREATKTLEMEKEQRLLLAETDSV